MPDPLSNTSEFSHPVFAVFVVILGAIVGSFLNVVIHRLPRGLTVHHPRRSFCPSCERQLAWIYNLPILSWLLLRGRCAYCKAPISPRYLIVEALTGGLFLAVWFHAAPHLWLVLGLWTFVSICVAASFIDLEHMIIPNALTWGGAGAGVIFSALAPALHDTPWRIEAIGWALAGALGGYFLLWGVVELGKLAFGRVRVNADPPEAFELSPLEEQGRKLQIGPDALLLEETFSRESDRLVLTCPHLTVNAQSFSNTTVRIAWDRIELPDRSVPLDQITTLKGTCQQLIIPREAMGFGDVKFMAAIGAFLGWKAVIAALMIGSLVGAVVGVATMAIRRSRQSLAIPFGPFLAVGALGWIFFGPQIVSWYFAFLEVP